MTFCYKGPDGYIYGPCSRELLSDLRTRGLISSSTLLSTCSGSQVPSDASFVQFGSMFLDPCPLIDLNQAAPNPAASNSDASECIGTVQNWGRGKYGFITSNAHDGQLFCHCTQLRNATWLRKGDEVKYRRRLDQGGKWEAVDVYLIPKMTSRKRQNRSENSQPAGFPRRNRVVGLTESERESLTNNTSKELDH